MEGYKNNNKNIEGYRVKSFDPLLILSANSHYYNPTRNHLLDFSDGAHMKI